MAVLCSACGCSISGLKGNSLWVCSCSTRPHNQLSELILIQTGRWRWGGEFTALCIQVGYVQFFSQSVKHNVCEFEHILPLKSGLRSACSCHVCMYSGFVQFAHYHYCIICKIMISVSQIIWKCQICVDAIRIGLCVLSD